jgi:hypothetical protein
MCLDSLDSVEGGQAGIWKCHDEGKNQVTYYCLINSMYIIQTIHFYGQSLFMYNV